MARNSSRDDSDIEMASGEGEIRERGEQAREEDEKRNSADDATKATSLQAPPSKKKRKRAPSIAVANSPPDSLTEWMLQWDRFTDKEQESIFSRFPAFAFKIGRRLPMNIASEIADRLPIKTKVAKIRAWVDSDEMPQQTRTELIDALNESDDDGAADRTVEETMARLKGMVPTPEKENKPSKESYEPSQSLDGNDGETLQERLRSTPSEDGDASYEQGPVPFSPIIPDDKEDERLLIEGKTKLNHNVEDESDKQYLNDDSGLSSDENGISIKDDAFISSFGSQILKDGLYKAKQAASGASNAQQKPSSLFAKAPAGSSSSASGDRSSVMTSASEDVPSASTSIIQANNTITKAPTASAKLASGNRNSAGLQKPMMDTSRDNGIIRPTDPLRPENESTKPALVIEQEPQSSKSISKKGVQDPKDLPFEDNRYGFTVKMAVDAKYSAQTVESAIRDMKLTIQKMPLWNPALFLPKISDMAAAQQTILNTTDALNDGILQSDTKQLTLRSLAKKVARMSAKDRFSRIQLFLDLCKLAEYFGTYESKRSVGHKGITLEVEALDECQCGEFGSEEAAASMKTTNYKQWNDSRKVWRNRKRAGARLVKFTEKFGIGVLLCIPEYIDEVTILDKSVVMLHLIRHGLENGPYARYFKALCDAGSEWMKFWWDSPETELVQNPASNFFEKFLSLIEVFPDSTDSIEDAIELYPQGLRNISIGDSGSYPHVDSMKTLIGKNYLNDEIIMTMLGYFLVSSPNRDKTMILDCCLTTNSLQGSKPLQVPEDKTLIYIPIHHKTSGFLHWSLAIVDLEKKTVRHFDSLPPSGLQSTSTDRGVCWKLQTILFPGCGLVKPQNHQSPPRQETGYDCGVHAIYNGMQVMYDKPLENPDCQKLRAHFANNITFEVWIQWAHNGAEVQRLYQDEDSDGVIEVEQE